MGVGMGEAWAAQLQARECLEAVIGGVEPGVLTGKHDQAFEPARHKGRGDREQLDGFGTSADDKPDFSGTQPSP